MLWIVNVWFFATNNVILIVACIKLSCMEKQDWKLKGPAKKQNMEVSSPGDWNSHCKMYLPFSLPFNLFRCFYVNAQAKNTWFLNKTLVKPQHENWAN